MKLSSASIYFRPGVTCNKSRLRAYRLQTDSWECSQHPASLPFKCTALIAFNEIILQCPAMFIKDHCKHPLSSCRSANISALSRAYGFTVGWLLSTSAVKFFKTFNLSLEHTWLHPSGRKSFPSFVSAIRLPIGAINKKNFLAFSTGTIFLLFTLNAFCTFYLLSMKSFAIFQLIEKAHWVLLSAFGIFSLCSSTESTTKAITDCAALVSSTYADDASEGINHKVEVCFHRISLFLSLCYRWFVFNSILVCYVSIHRLKSSLQRLSSKASHCCSPVDISTSMRDWCIRL